MFLRMANVYGLYSCCMQRSVKHCAWYYEIRPVYINCVTYGNFYLRNTHTHTRTEQYMNVYEGVDDVKKVTLRK